MSNVSVGNPWILDTAETIRTTPVKVTKMVCKPQASGNDITVTDGAGRTMWDVDALAAAPAGEVEIDFGEGIWFPGFIVSVIDGTSTLTVYIK